MRASAATPAGSPPTTPPRPLRRTLAALAAVAAQFSQALTSLLFALLGLRVLPAADFGLLGLLLGVTVLATGLMTGLVGDSLTVLDRHARPVRAALLWCSAGLALGLLVLAAATAWVLGLLGPASALLFGAGVAAFTLEDTGRRLLMANLRFWSVVAVDLAYAVAAGAVLLARATAAGPLVLADFLLALLVGQVVALLVAVALLPPAERVVTWAAPDLRHVVSYGAWRAAHQAVRPGALTVLRSLVLATAGAVSLAAFEAGRLYVSPALLVMQGTGSFLLATDARRQDRPVAEVLRRADRVAALLAGSGLLLGLALLALLPWLGPILTGGGTEVVPASVLAWSTVAAASGLSMPYGTSAAAEAVLSCHYGTSAAVRARPQRVLAVRLADTAVALSVVGVLVALPARWQPWLPVGVALGLGTSAVLQRRLVARSAAGQPAGAATGAAAADGGAGRR